MPSPRPEHVVALHPLEAGIGVYAASRESVADMEWPVHVGEGKGYHLFWSVGVRVSFEEVGSFPSLLPFLLDLLCLAHEPTDYGLCY